ncbi:MAG: 16S rRNA (cytosine(1402)-N(4))-methyltransferase RsmH [Flavobacteriales bacterium]|jgi:16S rRNA (cytosine1402-N4)-methyltransferase|nr:16S rRNA (cytosine(1402)-N(4))-methyltransferase RsmH [Flavobacteriales bacterium]MCB0759424.1 16S rRNA (cytosine(1402)-N(4))-methyltransferase RsmH [Flavobacteriales bacterium]
MTGHHLTYHEPVLLQECIEALDIKPDGVYVDVTFGGGGHARAILAQLGPQGSLVAFDRDADARRNAPDDPRFTLIASDFRWIAKHLRFLNKIPVDGLLADLGVSSHQFDTAGRGFSFRFDAPLDMRMNQRAKRTAADLVNSLDERALTELLRNYGEVYQPHKVARQLVQARGKKRIGTTGELVDLLKPLARRGEEHGFLAQVFQALRIAVNDELGSLEHLLRVSAEVVKPGGRLVVMSYHSLEDRLVKNWMKTGDLQGREEKDVFGNSLRPFKPTQSKAVQPSDAEQLKNPRSRSARLRTAVRQ